MLLIFAYSCWAKINVAQKLMGSSYYWSNKIFDFAAQFFVLFSVFLLLSVGTSVKYSFPLISLIYPFILFDNKIQRLYSAADKGLYHWNLPNRFNFCIKTRQTVLLQKTPRHRFRRHFSTENDLIRGQTKKTAIAWEWSQCHS